MGRNVVIGLGLLLLGGLLAILVASWFPALPARFAPPGRPFYAVVMHEGQLALVAQLEYGPDWVRLDATHSAMDLLDCRCPVLPPDGDLLALQAHSNLEFIEVRPISAGQYLLEASMDDLGGPKVGYRYRCGDQGLTPLLASEEVLGLLVPRLSWSYLASFVLVWMAAASAVWRLVLRR